MWHELWEGRPDEIAAAIDPDYDHASWSENFPWTRLPGVALPEERKPPVEWPEDGNPETWREALGDGSFGGLYQRSPEDEGRLWEAAVQAIRSGSNGGTNAGRRAERLGWMAQATASSRSGRRSQPIGLRRLLYSLRPDSGPERGSPMSNYEAPTDSLDRFLRDAGRRPLLTAAQEIKLTKLVERGDAGAKQTMIESNLRLVVSIAKKYRTRGSRSST